MRKTCEIKQDGGGDTDRAERWRQLKRWEDGERKKEGKERKRGHHLILNKQQNKPSKINHLNSSMRAV